MAGSFESRCYISSRSADVILSDVRPIKLKLEALRSINVFLDDFLHKILNAAGSLSTDSLKAGLNKILPTALGKEAVLEAELELKAYWERNTPHTPAKQEFDLQWSFELLRLKCEAYSTMNDGDEDLEAEKRLNKRMINAGGSSSPHNSLAAPAALYLTAILEHVLSNVGRVASRDSTRTVATVHNLFVALCEDSSMYSMFKGMKEQRDGITIGLVLDLVMFREDLKLCRTLDNTAPLSSATLQGISPGPCVQTDDDWDTWLATAFGTEYHPSCSCAMLLQNQGGVVDANLKVMVSVR
ncbi:hypothetical protein PHLCEN_2v9497 [Hermanssonia centrifuga]|uniref:Glucose-methanol-choline oxidoreductase C-terminal domain-containing protein n=1 Tax=Hermanssonia centrifuga TaxID=98765 RepID=A0A2R6NQN2_9APHY|nr:hypothetical protein PHLCEN_2v9497 [Hermanssonia centrifuga]